MCKYKMAGIALAALMLAGCKIQITVPEGGTVESVSGLHECAAGESCFLDVVDIFFDETFVAVPASGYEFAGWEKKYHSLCGGKSKPCHLYTSNFADNPTLTGFLESPEEAFFLQPIFRKIGSNGNDPIPPNPFSKYDGVWRVTIHSATLKCANGNRVTSPATSGEMRVAVNANGNISSIMVKEPPAPEGYRVISETEHEHRIYPDGSYRSRGEVYAYATEAGHFTATEDTRGTFSNSNNMSGTSSIRGIYHDLAGECWGNPRATMVKISQ